MPDASDIDEAIAQSAVDPASVSVDGQSVTSQDPMKQIAVRRFIAGQSALEGTNANGGPRSGWGLMRPAKVVPPGMQ